MSLLILYFQHPEPHRLAVSSDDVNTTDTDLPLGEFLLRGHVLLQACRTYRGDMREDLKHDHPMIAPTSSAAVKSVLRLFSPERQGIGGHIRPRGADYELREHFIVIPRPLH